LAKRVKGKILQTSTSEVYGDPKIHPQFEEYWWNVNPIGTRACYDEGKRCAETLFFDYFRQHRVRIKVARIFNTYGPRMHPNDGRVVSNFIMQALRGSPITLYGDGSQTRSFCYVEDLVDALIRLMGTADDVSGPINFGNPREFTIRELAAKIIEMTGSRSKLVFETLPADDPRLRQPNISLAKTQLDWSPQVELDEGLRRTWLISSDSWPATIFRRSCPTNLDLGKAIGSGETCIEWWSHALTIPRSQSAKLPLALSTPLWMADDATFTA
jgi:UDP-glucuronate decarboxylase